MARTTSLTGPGIGKANRFALIRYPTLPRSSGLTTRGDFASVLHVLVSQLEHSLRHILKLADIKPSVIPSGMIQENWTLPMMLKDSREPLESALGPAIVFEIENLFHHKGGPTFRHKVAYGPLSSAESLSPDSIYACWFMFRFCCLRIGANPIPAERDGSG